MGPDGLTWHGWFNILPFTNGKKSKTKKRQEGRTVIPHSSWIMEKLYSSGITFNRVSKNINFNKYFSYLIIWVFHIYRNLNTDYVLWLKRDKMEDTDLRNTDMSSPRVQWGSVPLPETMGTNNENSWRSPNALCSQQLCHLGLKRGEKKILCRANVKKNTLFAKYFNELHSLFFWTIFNAVTVSNRNIITQSIP